MPIVNQQTPTVTVQVPIPTPANTAQPANIPQPSESPKPRRPKRPTRIVQEDQAQIQQPVQPIPRAIILPWVPNVGKQNPRIMKRLPKRITRLPGA